MTAYSSSGFTARSFDGDQMVVVMAFNPYSSAIVPDEDTIRYEIGRIVDAYLSQQQKFYLHLEYYTDVVGYIDALEAHAELEGDETAEWMASVADNLLHDFFNNFAIFAAEKFAADPAEDPTNEELWIRLLRANALRRSSYNWTQAHGRGYGQWEWHAESFYDYRRYYSRGVEQASRQIRELVDTEIRQEDEDDWEVWKRMKAQRDSIKDRIELIERELALAIWELQLKPTSSEEAEVTYLELLDQVARAYPHWAQKSLLDPQGGIRSFRMLEPVGFSGENRIVAIVEWPREFHVLHLLYGDTLPDEFVTEYLRRVTDSLTVFNDGVPVAQYGG